MKTSAGSPSRSAPAASRLNPEQLAAVSAEGHVLVSACPGSGKTKTLEERIRFLLLNSPTVRIAGVTFTKEAATSLCARVLKRVSDEVPRAGARVTIATFHSHCLAQLRLARRPTNLAGESDSRMLMRRAYTALAPALTATIKFEDVVKEITAWKTNPNLILPTDPADVCRMVTASKVMCSQLIQSMASGSVSAEISSLLKPRSDGMKLSISKVTPRKVTQARYTAEIRLAPVGLTGATCGMTTESLLGFSPWFAR